MIREVTFSAMVVFGVACAKPAPSVPYEHAGLCPFECCTYRAWSVERDTPILVDRHDGAAVSFLAQRGQQVEGLTGVVITTKLGHAVVRRPVTLSDGRIPVEPDDTVSILTYVGEGYWRYWVRGVVGEDQIPGPSEKCVDEQRGQINCALQVTQEPETVWWARIRGADGREGWTRQLDHFGNIDACG